MSILISIGTYQIADAVLNEDISLWDILDSLADHLAEGDTDEVRDLLEQTSSRLTDKRKARVADLIAILSRLAASAEGGA